MSFFIILLGRLGRSWAVPEKTQGAVPGSVFRRNPRDVSQVLLCGAQEASWVGLSLASCSSATALTLSDPEHYHGADSRAGFTLIRVTLERQH